MPLIALKAAAVAGALLAGGIGAQSELAGNSAQQQASASHRVYIVRSGDTLSKIAGEFCGSPAKYPALARASGIVNPNVISVGQRVVLACGRSGGSARQSTRTASITGSSYAQGSANIPATSSVLSFAGLERIWMAAGGSSGTAYHAACIAEHESSGREWAVSPTNDWGLWQIHNGGPAMLNGFANARQAVAMSGNGSSWSQWTTRGMC